MLVYAFTQFVLLDGDDELLENTVCLAAGYASAGSELSLRGSKKRASLS